MTEDEARQVELVRAIETEDRAGSLITREDVAQAEAHARSASQSLGTRRASDTFLSSRATFLSARLVTRHPAVASVLRRTRWPGWLGVGLPVIAAMAGFTANEFGNGKRLDLLAVPLLGTIAWNIVVYLWLLLASVGPNSAIGTDPLYRAIARLAGFRAANIGVGTPLQRAANAFDQRWAAASATLVGARVARTLHLSAALFAIGLIGGIYLRALVVEYRAGWESTFLNPTSVHAVLSAILGPASWVSGVAIPSVQGIAAIQWTGPQTGGVNAAPWIHLYTVTVLGLVVIPRLVLSVWQGARGWRLSKRFPMPGREDFYLRRLLRSAGSDPSKARVTPYAYQPGQETRRRLAEALQSAVGDGAEVRFDEPVGYGAEESWTAAHPTDPDDDYHILLFTLSATPENENHGALAGLLAARMKRERAGTILAAIVDESPFRSHFAGQSGLAERIEARLQAWRKVLSAAAGIAPLSIDLAQQPGADLAQRIESGLIPDGAMHG